MLHVIFWRPFPASLNEKDLKVNLKSEKIITKPNIFRIFLGIFINNILEIRCAEHFSGIVDGVNY